MRARTSVRLLILGNLLLPALAPAQAPAPLAGRAVYVADSADDRVLCFVDRDGSGAVEPGVWGEALVFYDDTGAGPDLSGASALVVSPDSRLYLLDGGSLDAVYVLEDLDGDGTANGAGEIRVFYDDTSPGPNLSTPGALAAAPGGVLYVADDGRGAQRVLRLSDLDGDGSANGAAEWKVVYDKTALSPSGGPLLDIEALASYAGGRLLASDSTLGRIYLFRDGNGDGDFLDADEAVVFYDPLGGHPFTHLQGLAAGPGGEAYAGDQSTGLVVRLQDLNGDGDALDAGEATVFLDPAAPPHLKKMGDLTVDADGTLVVLDTSRDAVFLAWDLNGDGAAGGDGETVSWIADAGALLSTPAAVAVGPAPPLPPEPHVAIQGLEPATGSLSGGTTVHITGKFPSPQTAEVDFGGVHATIIAASLDGIDCVAPPGAKDGPVDVKVSTSAGEAVRSAGYTYRSDVFLRGDGNGDGGLDISDAVAILTYLFLGGPAPSCADTYDADDDGTLSITDGIFLLSFLFQSGPAIPPPHLAPGPDPTPDSLPCPGSPRA